MCFSKTRMKKVIITIMAAVMCFSFAACAKTPEINPAKDLDGLKGKVVYNIGQGAVPDLTFRYILKQRGIQYELGSSPKDGVVRLAYTSGDKIGGLLESGKASYAIAAEPVVANVLKSVAGSSILLDIQQMYGAVTNSSATFPQSCLVVKSEFLANYAEFVGALCTELSGSKTWAENNPETAKTALIAAGAKSMNNLSSDVAKRCNVIFESAADSKSRVETYLGGISGVTIGDEPSPIGGKLPDSGYYADIPAHDGEYNIPTAARIIMPDGSPALAFAKLINDAFGGAAYKIVQPATIGLEFLNNADMAIMPLNTAAKLYNDGATPLKMLSLVTGGSLFLLTKTA